MTFLTWLAHSPIASFLKTFGAACLGWLILNAETLGIHPALVMGLVAALPVIINWLNPEYDNYGRTNPDVAN
jgi:hypothetical protein